MTDSADALMRAVVLAWVTFLITAAGMSLVRKWRDRANRADGASNEMMTNFRELHSRGGLSDEEFRTIKAKLASSVKTELHEKGSAG